MVIAIMHARQRRHDRAEGLGEHHLPIVWPNVRPIARAASAWPSGTALTPERTASQTNAEV